MGNEGSEKVLQIEWSEMIENMSRLASLRALQFQRDVQRGDLAARLTTVLEARNRQRAEEDHLTALKAHCLDRQEYLQSLRSAAHQEEKTLAVDNREIGIFLEALKTGAHCIAQATHRLQDAERLLSGAAGRGQQVAVLRHLLRRRQRLAAQLACLYPITQLATESDSQTAPSRIATSPPVEPAAPENGLPRTFPLAIAGNPIPSPRQQLMDALTLKQEQPSLATALGCTAQVVSLLAKYFGVHLLYPLTVAASRSSVNDPHSHSHSHYLHIESGNGRAPTAGEGSVSRSKWPLYAEGQELSAVETGINLLNKDIEQLLCMIGEKEQSGPSDVLHNLLHLFIGIENCNPG